MDGTPGATSSAVAAGNFTKSYDLWYSDGSIVIVAEKCGFRVHTSILAAASEVFRDMAALPQPKSDDDGEIFEECPVIRLQDSATDMRHFLKAIYDNSHFSQYVKTTFPIVAGVLRLSTKYQAVQLRQSCVNLLTTAFPSTLMAWDHRNTKRLIRPFEGEYVACISLAMETHVDVTLPAAYYAASRYPISTVMKELQKTGFNGSVREEVYVALATGLDALRKAEVQLILTFLKPDFLRPTCQNGNDAQTLLRHAAAILPRTVEAETYQRWCSDNPNKVGSSIGLCVTCCATVERSIREARENIWNQIPGFFGLPEWEVLRARDLQDESGPGDSET